MKRITVHPTPWEWLIALIVLQATDVATTRIAVANANLIEGNPLLYGVVSEWWFLAVKMVVVLGLGVLLLKSPKVLMGATLFYFGLILGNIIVAVRVMGI